MVGQNEDRARRRSRPDFVDSHADQRAENAMVQMGNGPLQPQIEDENNQLERHQHQREYKEGQCEKDCSDHEAVR